MLRATRACTFSTSQIPKVVRSAGVLCILTSRSVSRHNGVHFFPHLSVLRATIRHVFFRHLDFQTCSDVCTHLCFSSTYIIGNLTAKRPSEIYLYFDVYGCLWYMNAYDVFCLAFCGYLDVSDASGEVSIFLSRLDMPKKQAPEIACSDNRWLSWQSQPPKCFFGTGVLLGSSATP